MEAPQQSLQGPLLRHKGSPSGRGLAADGPSLPAPGTKDQSGRRPRGRGRARPLKGRDEPPRCRSPGPPSRLAPHGRRGMEATYLSLRRRWLRVAARRPRGRALEPHTAPLARPRRRTTRPTPRAPAPPPPPPPPPTQWAGQRPPGPFKPGPYHRAGRGRPGRAERQGSRAGAAPPWGRERPTSRPPSRNGRVRGARLSPAIPRPGPPPPATLGPARARATPPLGPGARADPAPALGGAPGATCRRRCPSAQPQVAAHLLAVTMKTTSPLHATLTRVQGPEERAPSTTVPLLAGVLACAGLQAEVPRPSLPSSLLQVTLDGPAPDTG
ncbi:basic proline-rich protein-like [Eubalaena glacialis]|uniref:basic proline-rich protein-like n=1 Tax=Eubalaena glacialis TaxID=27606 RepID=UPI002A5A2AEC|nr:basic proline-rich protein-like [Eubalaena glacialis]